DYCIGGCLGFERGLEPEFGPEFVPGFVGEPTPGFVAGSLPGPGSAVGGGGIGAAEVLLGNWTLPGPSGGAASPGRRSDGGAVCLPSSSVPFEFLSPIATSRVGVGSNSPISFV